MTKLSKKLCYVLRHNHASIDLPLDKNGYANVDELLVKLNRNNTSINIAILTEIVLSDKKSRFSFNADKSKIRANYGHSFAVELGLEPLRPPPLLYHGTAERNVESILKNGLNKAKRNYVHLADNISAAAEVGGRYGTSAVLQINAEKMLYDGYVFYKSGVVWLTDYVLQVYLCLL